MIAKQEFVLVFCCAECILQCTQNSKRFAAIAATYTHIYITEMCNVDVKNSTTNSIPIRKKGAHMRKAYEPRKKNN